MQDIYRPIVNKSESNSNVKNVYKCPKTKMAGKT